MTTKFILSQSELDYQSVTCSNNHYNRSLNCVLNNIYTRSLVWFTIWTIFRSLIVLKYLSGYDEFFFLLIRAFKLNSVETLLVGRRKI